jgi:hypothetical protein
MAGCGLSRSRASRPTTFLMGMDRERKMASWHLVAPNGRTYSGGEAVPQLARLLPAGAPIAW